MLFACLAASHPSTGSPRPHAASAARLGLVLAVPAVLVTAAFVPSPAAASIDRDGISAVTAGGRVDGYIDWQDFAGHVYSNVLLKDTAADSRCADLYFRQRNAGGASTGWVYLGHACGKNVEKRFSFNNNPFQGGTSGFDFRVTQSEGGPSAYDYNALMGD